MWTRLGCRMSARRLGPAGGFQGSPGSDRNPLHRRRRIHLKKIQQAVTAHVSQPARKEHGEDTIFADGLMQGDNQVLCGDGSFAEKLFHQLVFAFGHQLHQRLVGSW